MFDSETGRDKKCTKLQKLHEQGRWVALSLTLDRESEIYSREAR